MLEADQPDKVDLLDAWQETPQSRELAFDISRTEPAVWRIEVPSDVNRAIQALDLQRSRLAAMQEDLPRAAQSLDTFTQVAAHSGKEASFAFAETSVSEADRELSQWLFKAAGEESYKLDLDWMKGWEKTRQQTLAFFEQVQHYLSHYAWVESASGGDVFCRTIVDWLGDFQTYLQDKREVELVESHTHSLALVLASRSAWMRMAVLVAQGAIKLAVLVPANPLLALPAAWKYIKQILEQYQQIRGFTSIS